MFNQSSAVFIVIVSDFCRIKIIQQMVQISFNYVNLSKADIVNTI